MIRNLYLIGKTIFIEAVRRREIYGIVLLTVFLLGWAGSFQFFDMASLHRFYQEIALQIMSIATMITVIVLAAIQLPREFSSRTIYTVLAKPIRRFDFMLGKYCGVVAAGVFCLSLFMAVFLLSNIYLKYPLNWLTFFQYIYLQILLIGLVASLAFVLSLLFNQDAAITLTALIFLLGQIYTTFITIVYGQTTELGRAVLLFINYAIPQPALYDLSNKVIHGWPPIGAEILAMLTGYTAAFVALYLGISFFIFRRKPL